MSAPSSNGGSTPPTAYSDDGSANRVVDVVVQLPDLFIDIMAAPCAVNPTYDQVKPEADAWTEKILKMDEKTARRNRAADLCLLSAMWLPGSDAAGLRLMTDWNHWGFPWDDQFDEGEFKFDTMGGALEVIDTLAVLDETQVPISADEDPLKFSLQTVWLQYKERTSPYMQDRLRRQHRGYALGCLQQTVWSNAGHPKRSVNEYLDYRRLSIGAYPVFIFSEAGMGIDLPREVREHPAIRACEDAMVDMVIIHNDICSMRKDVEYGVEHNLVTWMLDLGMTPQQAMDKCGAMLDECFAQWHTNRAKIPSWGEALDKDVAVLLDIFRDLALGSLHWSFVTGRYLGTEGAEVRRTRMLKLKLPEKWA